MVRTTTGFVFELRNEPGQLQEVTQRLAKRDVNIDGIGALATGETGAIELVTDEPGSTRTALESTGLSFDEVETIVVDVPDRPGELDQCLEALAAEEVNVEAVFPVSGSPSRLAFTVDDPDTAATILEG
jgi:hypothetical protein